MATAAKKRSPRAPSQAARGRRPSAALRIGWAAREITPLRPAMLQGQMHCRVGRSALDPLLVTAMALEASASGEGVVLVSCDLAFIPDNLLRRVRGDRRAHV